MNKLVIFLGIVIISTTVLARELPQPKTKTITALCAQSVGAVGDELQVTLKRIENDNSYTDILGTNRYIGTAVVAGHMINISNGVDNSKNISRNFAFIYSDFDGLTIKTKVAGVTIKANTKKIQRDADKNFADDGKVNMELMTMSNYDQATNTEQNDTMKVSCSAIRY